MTEVNYDDWWSLVKRASGEVYDLKGVYGERNVVYGRIVHGVAVSVEEAELTTGMVRMRLFVEWREEEDLDEEDSYCKKTTQRDVYV